MKVSVTTSFWKNSSGGGIKTYLTNLVDELKKRGNIEVSVVFNEGEDPENYKIYGNKFLFSIKSFFVLEKIRPDVIHSQETWYCLLPGYIYKKLHGSTLVHTFHTDFTPMPDKKLSLIGRLFMSFLLNGCNYVTFVSKGLENKIDQGWKLNFNSKRAVTYAGINHDKVSNGEINKFTEKFGIKNGSIVLLALGLTQLSYKAEGAKILIKSVRILKNKHPEIILVLTRDGIYSDRLKEFAIIEGVGERVIFTGDIEDPNIPLSLCDIYTHITLGEGFGLAVLEAMSIGKPIIATSVGGIPEMIEDGINGLLVKPDAEMVAEKIEKFIEDKKLARQLGENAKKIVEEKFTWKISVDNFLKLYSNEV